MTGYQEDRTLQRGRTAFFTRRSVSHSIAQIAASDRILIYAGAGVTLDRSAVSWRELARSLAQAVGLDDQQTARLDKAFPPLHLASLIVEKYSRRYPTQWLQHIVLNIRDLLYGEREWRGGQFARATALLCAAFVRAGADVLVATTNYDQYLEAALDEAISLNEEWEDVRYESTAVTGRAADGEDFDGGDWVSRAAMTIRLVHVHGIIGERPDEELDKYLVLSENDYHDSAGAVDSLLGTLFRTRDVLILGSGLDDPPLLRALSQSRNEAKAGLRRWAVFPRQSLSVESAPYVGVLDSAEDIMTSMRTRAAQFRLELITPDFFAQAAQFPQEVACLIERARQEGSRDYDSLIEQDNYSFRLQRWWQAWHDSRKDDLAPAQEKCHRQLYAALDRLREILGDWTEGLKLELWIRWRPAERKLRLWASSTGTWRDQGIMRSADIEWRSRYAAVNVFCTGSAEVIDTTETSDRWARYLAVPIRAGQPPQSLIVGVMALATTKVEGSRLNADDGQAMTALTEELTRLGNSLVQ